MILGRFQGKPFNITVIQVHVTATDAEEPEAGQSCEDLENLLELTPISVVVFISGDWYAKAGSQEIPGVTGKISLGEEKEPGQRLTEFCQDNALIIANTLLNNTRDELTHGHHQMGNTKSN